MPKLASAVAVAATAATVVKADDNKDAGKKKVEEPKKKVEEPKEEEDFGFGGLF